MENIDLLFSACRTSADLTTMERHARFTDDTAKASLENLERVSSIHSSNSVNQP